MPSAVYNSVDGASLTVDNTTEGWRGILLPENQLNDFLCLQFESQSEDANNMNLMEILYNCCIFLHFGFMLSLAIPYVTSFPKFQYPEYADAYLRLASIAKARNNVQLSNELVVVLSLYRYLQTVFC